MWLGHHFQGQKVKVTRLRSLNAQLRRLQRWACERVGREKLLLRCRLLGRARRFGASALMDRGAGRGILCPLDFIFVGIFDYSRKWKMFFGRPYIIKRCWSWFWGAKSWSWSWTLGLVLVLVLTDVLITHWYLKLSHNCFILTCILNTF